MTQHRSKAPSDRAPVALSARGARPDRQEGLIPTVVMLAPLDRLAGEHRSVRGRGIPTAVLVSADVWLAGHKKSRHLDR